MYGRLALIIAVCALVVSLAGITVADAARVIKRALNADSVGGIRASRSPTAGRLLPLGKDKRFPVSVMPTGARGPRGPEGPAGALGAAGGDLAGSFPNPTLRAGAVSADEVANPFVFRAHKVAAQDTPTDGFTRVLLGAEVFDPSASFDPASSTFTVPVTGYWHLSAAVGMCCGGGRMFGQITSSRLGTSIRGSDITSNGILQSVASALTHLQRGDTVTLEIYTSAVNQMGPTELTFLTGFLVSAG